MKPPIRIAILCIIAVVVLTACSSTDMTIREDGRIDATTTAPFFYLFPLVVAEGNQRVQEECDYLKDAVIKGEILKPEPSQHTPGFFGGNTTEETIAVFKQFFELLSSNKYTIKGRICFPQSGNSGGSS